MNSNHMHQQKKLWFEHKKLESEMINKEWLYFSSEIEKIATNYGELWENFLRTPIIQHTMYVCSFDDVFFKKLQFLKQFFSLEIAKEPLVGNPVVQEGFSHNTIHHLYHISQYMKAFSANHFKSVENYVEWGGGFGNFARLTKLINPQATYTIIDLPIMNILQYRYLSSVLGEDSVNILERNQTPATGKVNLVPSTYYETNNINADFFVSTWALSETPVSVQEKVNQLNWFGAKQGLFAMHSLSPPETFGLESTNLRSLLQKQNYSTQSIQLMNNQVYMFK